MPKGSLPGYVWSSSAHSYQRIALDGTLESVTRDEIVRVLHLLARSSERMLGELALSIASGDLSETDGVRAGMRLLKDLYNANSALARGGWSQMDFAAWGRNGQILRGEYAYWRQFMSEVASGVLSDEQIRARAALYIGKAYSRFWAEDRLLKLADARLSGEQWLDMDDEHECSDCQNLASLGRLPLGTLRTVPGAGDTQCLGNCRCAIVYW